jgi:hypothetical protein
MKMHIFHLILSMDHWMDETLMQLVIVILTIKAQQFFHLQFDD